MNNLGVKLPERKHQDWYNAKYDTCDHCGNWAAIADGQCAECHDADDQADTEDAYKARIIELMDFARFMCETWADVDEWAYVNVSPDALLKYPVIQGRANQLKLKRIGEQKYDPENIKKAVDHFEGK